MIFWIVCRRRRRGGIISEIGWDVGLGKAVFFFLRFSWEFVGGVVLACIDILILLSAGGLFSFFLAGFVLRWVSCCLLSYVVLRFSSGEMVGDVFLKERWE